jgi:hypothetical protein
MPPRSLATKKKKKAEEAKIESLNLLAVLILRHRTICQKQVASHAGIAPTMHLVQAGCSGCHVVDAETKWILGARCGDVKLNPKEAPKELIAVSIYLYIYVCIYLSTYLFIYLYMYCFLVYLPVCLTICFSVCLSVCLFIFLSICVF